MWHYRKYVSVGERMNKAEAKLKKMLKKNPNMRPIRIDGNKIATTWWGKAWATNLTAYADYSNRIGRGRSYVKNGLVIDLAIGAGKISAMVMGSTSTPYKVKIQISKMNKASWKNILVHSKEYFHSLAEILEGRFPKEMALIFSSQEKGLFPAPAEMSFDCSCPDWASMCKHVSAALFGVAARLDESPELLFKLRGVEVHELIATAIKGEVKKLSQKKSIDEKNKLVMPANKLASLFNIQLATPKSLNSSSSKKKKKKKMSKKKIKK